MQTLGTDQRRPELFQEVYEEGVARRYMGLVMASAPSYCGVRNSDHRNLVCGMELVVCGEKLERAALVERDR